MPNRTLKQPQPDAFERTAAGPTNMETSDSNLSNKQIMDISIVGSDHIGTVAKATKFLFDSGANIEALEEQVLKGRFRMNIQASWESNDWDYGAVKAGLARLAEELKMTIRYKYRPVGEPQRFVIFGSREKHLLPGIMQAVEEHTIQAIPSLVISNHQHLQPLAEQYRLPFRYLDWSNRQKAENQALEIMEDYNVDFLVLARFMKILSPQLVWHYKNKIINIHPSLLPSFPGQNAYRQAWEHGVKVIGVTAHFVNMHLDEGPIITQSSFEVSPNMTLKDIIGKGQFLETSVLIKAIQLYLNCQLDVYWGRVHSI